MGYSSAEIKDLSYRLETARKAIFNKYPEIVQMVKEKPETSCGYCNNSNRCGTDRFFDRFTVFEQNRSNRPTCRWGPYVAALALLVTAFRAVRRTKLVTVVRAVNSLRRCWQTR
jgi:hypothetical protein